MNALFPNLASEGFQETSPATSNYNCIAWTAGYNDLWWWPDAAQIYFWPEKVARVETLEAFIAAFATLGYLPCDNGQLDSGFEKIVIYVRDGKPTHAAKQLPDGTWSSKLGQAIDISHTLHGLEGSMYGNAAAFLQRRRQTHSTH